MAKKPVKVQPVAESGTAEIWLKDNDRLVVLGLMGLVLLLHLIFAATYALNPDEALHYTLANQASLHDAYVMNNTNAHPPVLIVSIYFWRMLGRSEWFLRLIPILCSLVMTWFAWRWAKLVLGGAAALVFAAFTALLPPLYSLSQDLRQYMPMMAGIAPALYFLEQAFVERPVRNLLISAAALQVAILSNYSAAWFTAGFGCYALIRLATQALPVAAKAAWAGGQVAAAATYGVLYVTHIAKLRQSEVASGVAEGWLRTLYRMPGDDGVAYVGRNVRGLLEYMFGSPGIAVVGSLLVIAGLVLPWLRRSSLRCPGALAALLAVPLLICVTVALRGSYPFGGSRHSILFCFLLGVPLALAVAEFAGRRMVVSLGAALAFLLMVQAQALPEVKTQPLEAQKRTYIVGAVDYLKERTARGGLVFVDYQTSLLLCYYADPLSRCPDQGNGYFWESKAGAARVAISRHWSLSPTGFVEELRELKRVYKLPPQAEVWVIDAGWGEPLHHMLQVQFSGSTLPDLRVFGGWTGVFRIPN